MEEYDIILSKEQYDELRTYKEICLNEHTLIMRIWNSSAPTSRIISNSNEIKELVEKVNVATSRIEELQETLLNVLKEVDKFNSLPWYKKCTKNIFKEVYNISKKYVNIWDIWQKFGIIGLVTEEVTQKTNP